MNNMRAIRKANGLTMKQLGEKVGMKESTISLYERGKHEPDIETMGRIADALNTTIDHLLGREEPDSNKEPAILGGLNDAVMALFDEAADLSPQEAAETRAFVLGLKANRKP